MTTVFVEQALALPGSAHMIEHNNITGGGNIRGQFQDVAVNPSPINPPAQISILPKILSIQIQHTTNMQ